MIIGKYMVFWNYSRFLPRHGWRSFTVFAHPAYIWVFWFGWIEIRKCPKAYKSWTEANKASCNLLIHAEQELKTNQS